MLIRKAEKKDLIPCENLVHIPEMELISGGFPNRLFLEKYLDENFFLVAEDNNVIVGLIFGEPVKANGAIVWMLCVSQDVRGNGIGSLLLENFEKKVKRVGIRWIILYGNKKNSKIREFYKKNQFLDGMDHVEFFKSIR